MRALLFSLFFVVPLMGCDSAPDETERRTLLLKNARIYTMAEGAQGTAKALCALNGVILYVGEEAQAAACAGPNKDVIDAQGRVVLPGLIDSHMHIFSGSISEQPVNLSQAETLADLRSALERMRDLNPGDAPIVARGWQHHIFPPIGPRASLLDEIFGDRVVIIDAADGHSTWFSSAAFTKMGVDAQTPDPAPGVSFFERDPQTGMPTGTAREGAGEFIKEALAPTTKADFAAALERWLPRANQAGLTALFDAGMAAPTQEDAYAILADLAANDALPLRVFSAVYASGQLYKGGDGYDPFELLTQLQDQFIGTHVRPMSIKVFVDGTPEGHTAFLLTPYADDVTTTGAPMLGQNDLDALVLAGQKAGVPIHMHAIGGGAVRMALDSVEKAQAETGHKDVLHAIAHMDFVAAADVPRFAELNVVAQTSIHWSAHDSSYENLAAYVGTERMDNAYPVKSIIDAGGLQTFGTDWPATTFLTTFKPFDMIEVAVTRRLPGKTDGPIRSENERLTIEEALVAMTRSVAIQLGQQDRIGTLEAGKNADFIMLNQDIFAIAPSEIHKTTSLVTVVGGDIVFDARSGG